MENLTFVELAALYNITIFKLDELDSKIAECWDNGDKVSAKSFVCGMDQHLDTLFEIEQILDLREEF